jgi:squalene-hopene/tetraprenyl-beta-curcumene cyclase
MFRFIAVLSVFTTLPAWCADWNPRLAATYLDSRQKQWASWAPANKEGVPCVSCHTGETYLLVRPALRKALGESQPTEYETGLLNSLRSRVGKKTAKEMFGENAKEPHASQAAAVESIFAALFLGTEAFDRMWSFQLLDGDAKGAWAWNTFDLDPWETPQSTFYGATLAAMATGEAPAEYRDRPDVRERVASLTAYLQRELPTQPLHNRLIALWASTKLPEAVPVAARRQILDEIWQKQQPDGGWTIEALGKWNEHPKAPRSVGTNSYATGLTAFILEKTGVAPSDPRLAKALGWLKSHQDPEFGYWDATSLNKPYEADYPPVLFMRDAATAYATLALLESRK